MAKLDSFSFTASALGLLLGAGGFAGCHRVSPSESAGRASFKFIGEPRPRSQPVENTKPEAAQPHEVFAPAEAVLPLATPIYPRIAAKDRGGWVVSVRVTIDDRGRVTGVAPSVFGFTTPSGFAVDFMAAVETAVRQWRFRPAEVHRVQLVTLEGGQSFLKVLGVERVETAFDVSFTFTAAGEVLLPSAP